MRIRRYHFYILLAVILCVFVYKSFTGTYSNINRLLKSDEISDIANGATKAAETYNKNYVPLLLKDANDPRILHNWKFKGMSVYQVKMNALSKIYNVKPPVEISHKPDSIVIKFFLEIYSKNKMAVK